MVAERERERESEREREREREREPGMVEVSHEDVTYILDSVQCTMA